MRGNDAGVAAARSSIDTAASTSAARCSAESFAAASTAATAAAAAAAVPAARCCCCCPAAPSPVLCCSGGSATTEECMLLLFECASSASMSACVSSRSDTMARQRSVSSTNRPQSSPNTSGICMLNESTRCMRRGWLSPRCSRTIVSTTSIARRRARCTRTRQAATPSGALPPSVSPLAPA
eukprot:352088-Chlamydomonas_euryale.AAC.16